MAKSYLAETFMNSVLLTTPYLTLCAALVVVIIIFEILNRSTKYLLTFVAAALAAFVIIMGIVKGADYEEVLIFAMIVFLLFAIGFFRARDGGQK